MVRIGTKLDNVTYTKRDGAYVIIEREEDDKIAIATDGTWFFLGGGLEKDETELEALKRELLDEAGYSIKDIKFFDNVTSWADGGQKGPLDVTATFYIAEFDKKITEPIEKDQKVLWVNPIDYRDKLYHEYQRYILDKYIKLKGGNKNV